MITFNWPPEFAARPEYGFRLSESIAAGARGWCYNRWAGVLASNLAVASLLGRAADIAYDQGFRDGEIHESGAHAPGHVYGDGYPSDGS